MMSCSKWWKGKKKKEEEEDGMFNNISQKQLTKT
jgi:hypothetical protein